MGLAAGKRLGQYEVHEQIGAGGMGEVYHATDTRLKRDVAIKVLSKQFSRDPERVAPAPQANGAIYNPSADGQRFLVKQFPPDAQSTVNLLTHWEQYALAHR